MKVVNNKALTCSSTLRSRLSDTTGMGTCTRSLPRPGALIKERKEDSSVLEIVGPGSVTHKNLNAEESRSKAQHWAFTGLLWEEHWLGFAMFKGQNGSYSQIPSSLMAKILEEMLGC